MTNSLFVMRHNKVHGKPCVFHCRAPELKRMAKGVAHDKDGFNGSVLYNKQNILAHR
jgi:hypothetical protein